MSEDHGNFVAEVRRRIRVNLNDLSDTITDGVADWATYQRLVGQIEGLALAERHLLDVAKLAVEGEGDA